VGLSQGFRRGVTGFVRAENVGNTTRYERDNSYIPMPRTLIIGANVQY